MDDLFRTAYLACKANTDVSIVMVQGLVLCLVQGLDQVSVQCYRMKLFSALLSINEVE